MTLKKRLSLYRKGHLGQVRYPKLQAAGIDKRNILLASRHRLGSNLKITPSGNDLGDGSRYLTCGTAFSRAQTRRRMAGQGTGGHRAGHGGAA